MLFTLTFTPGALSRYRAEFLDPSELLLGAIPQVNAGILRARRPGTAGPLVGGGIRGGADEAMMRASLTGSGVRGC